MTFAFARRSVLTAAGAFALAAPLAPVLVASPAYASGQLNDWFRVGDAALEDWHILAEHNDPYIARVVRAGRNPGEAAQKVMVVYPRPSSAYDVAITQILSVFAAKGIDADFTIYNFRKDDGRGKAALALAEAEGYDLIMSMGSESTA